MSEWSKEFLEERLKEAKQTEEKLTKLLIHYIGEKQKLKPENASLRLECEKLREELRDVTADRDGLRDMLSERKEEEDKHESDILRDLEYWRKKSIELSFMVRELKREKVEALRAVESCINEMEILKGRLEGMKNEG